MTSRALVVLAALLWGSAAQAYGFMIRHDYVACGQCHFDPSGGSLLTEYGRAQGELILRTRYGKVNEADEPGKKAGFLFGLLSMAPEELALGGDVRVALSAPGLQRVRVFPMQADLVGGLRTGKMTASVSLGVGSSATSPARIVGEAVQLISRHHWVGYSPDEDQSVMIRVGRMALPFGLRLPEHTTWVRAQTRTDTNVSQQHGLSLAYAGTLLRGELMAIAGNLQMTPPSFRERGYSGYLEASPTTWLAFGASSLLTHAESDPAMPTLPVFRNAHGLFARLAPVRALVVSVEADLTHVSRRTLGGSFGAVGLVHLDLEPTQGLHFVAMGEVLVPAFERGGEVALGAWAGAWWFFAPHADVRVDAITRRELDGSLNVSLLAQLHFFL